MSLEGLKTALADRYKIERELGQGGMATVYLAEDLKHHRKVAVKVLRPELAAVIGAERFLAEIRTTANLQHPHILPLFDSGQVESRETRDEAGTPSTHDSRLSTLFYVMPFIDGESLRDRLTREKQLPVADAMRIATEVASALDYAHRHGVIHRDIKPENILLHDGRALVADFGIALAASKAGSRMTETGMSLGTPTYMSPEQAMGEREVTARSDVYALGCVTYEMLIGEPPFTGPSAQAIVAKVMTAEPASLIEQRKTIPPAVEGAVLTALQKLPADRFASAAEFSAALNGNLITARPQVSSKGRAAEPPSRRAAPLVAFAILAAVAAWGWLRPHGSTSAPAIVTYLPPPAGVDFGGGRQFAALSPDGTRLAFVGFSSEGNTALWIWNLAARHGAPLEGTTGAEWPFWSPDGKTIGFFAGSWLTRVSAQGGGRTNLCRANAPRGAAWSKSGLILVVTAAGLIRASAGGGNCVPIDIGNTRHAWNLPSALPDGRQFVLAVGSDLATFELVILDAKTGVLRRIGDGGQPTFVPPDYLLYESFKANSSALLAQHFDPKRGILLGTPVLVADSVWEPGGDLSYSASANGVLVFRPGLPDLYDVLVNRAGDAQSADTLHQSETWTHAFARRHNWVVLGGSNLWLVDLSRHSIAALGSRGTSFGSIQYSPAWSPEDTALAYSSSCGIAVLRVADGQQHQIIPGPANFFDRCNEPTDWSPDGRELIVTVRPGDSVATIQIWRYRFADSSFAPLIAGEQNNMQGAVSPDGRWLAYASDATGGYEVYVAPYHGGSRGRRVSVQGGVRPRWRGDGHELFYYAPNYEVMSVAVGGKADLDIGPPTPLFHFPFVRADLVLATPYDVSSDGQRFVIHPPSTTPDAPLVMMLNWPKLVGLAPR